MKYRIAKKIINSRHWTEINQRYRPPYTYISDNGTKITCFPSCHDLPWIRKAKKRYMQHFKNINKKK